MKKYIRAFIKLCKKFVRLWKKRGIEGVINKIENMDNKINIQAFYDFIMDDVKIPLNKKEYDEYKDGQKIINWIIPEMGVGSGGHINIFRFVTNLENMGLHNRIYVHRGNVLDTNEQLRAFLDEHYNIDNKNIEVYNNVNEIKFAHATIATSWQTAYFVRKFDNTISKFYFVQDFEPLFYAVGSEYTFAENTYKFGFRGLTAGDWLKNKLRDEYGMKTDGFLFSYDKDMYVAKEKKDNVDRIFFYARPVTPRRSFELGMLALNELTKHMPDVEVIFAGWDVSNYEIPFKHVNKGSVKLEDLSELYAQCDMCLVLSNTNLSLLPLEVMASNSVAVCTNGENSSWLVDETNSIMVDFDPIEIAKTLEYYLKNKEKLREIRKNGLEFAKSTSWEKEALKVKEAILRGIEEDERA